MMRWLSGRLSALAVFILLSTLSAGIAKADDCSNEKLLKSQAATTQSELSFQNRSSERRRIYWIDVNGDRKFYGIVEPGNVFKQPTYVTHAWVVTDDAEKCLYTFIATAEPRAVDVGEAAVAPPSPGGQQPIVQAAPPVAQAAPQPTSDPTTIIASTADERLPQVSPVEQFQLRGAYRIVPQVNAVIALNSEASGTVDVIAAKPEWDSAQWSFEAVAGTPFVRIRNSWKGTYLADFNGKPRAMPAAAAAPESHWTFEPVDGTEFVQFRNRETDRFLLAVNGATALVDAISPDQQGLSLWRATAAAPGAVAAPPPPPRPLYDAAAAGCREVGGYWTGSSCRRPVYMTERLACPRGFVWAEETGECLWDGGSCPPWQAAPGGICGPNLVCRGGAVAPGPRGYPACYCPAGQVAWGNYPNLACVPSIARIAPLLLPAAVVGATVAIIGTNPGRLPIGQVYGNNRFCPPGQTGTPPNCVVAQTCPAPLVGTPPNCTRLIGTVRANTCPAGQIRASNDACVTITCAGGTMSQGACTCPAGTSRQGGGANFQCVAAATPPSPPIGGGGGTTADPICNLGERLVDHKCVKLNDAITCTGGRIDQGVCACPSGMRLTGSGNNFQCVAAQTTTPTTQRACASGENPQSANCQCNAPLQVFDNKCQAFTTIAPTTPTGGQRACTAGENPQTANCQCRQPLQVFDNKCQAFTTIAPTTPTQPAGGPPLCKDGDNWEASGCNCQPPLAKLPAGKCGQPTKAGAQCLEGQNIAATGCVCGPPLKQIENGFCGRLLLNETKPLAKGGICAEGADIKATSCQCNMNTVDVGGGKFICSANARPTGGGTTTNPTQPVGGPPLCTDGQNTASGCRCAAPLTVLPGGKCSQPTKPGAQCLEGQNIAATGCVCGPPLKQIENGFCGRLLLNETKPLAKGGTCAEGADIKATSCQCNMNTVDVGGGKFICSANARPTGGGTTTTTPVGGPPLCTDGQNTASGCRCAPPLTLLPAGKCGQPTKAGAQCLEGQNIAATGCVCGPPLKPIENGFCGRLLLNETKPLAKGGNCAEGQDIKATNCICNMKTVDAGGGKFICSANAAPPSGGRLAPAPVQPAPCPVGTTGTPPNCKANPPPTCPAGTSGTPPNCKANPPPTCPAGTTGTPPNCKANPPPTCPAGTTGTPPNCKANPPPTCPAGTTGTPPNCKANPPPRCPAGTTGMPPNCKANAPPPPPPPPKPVLVPPPPPKPPTAPPPPSCAPPKKLNPQGQCV